MKAFTRAVSPRIAECQLTHLERMPIDPAKAAAQHAAYEWALADAGFEIVRMTYTNATLFPLMLAVRTAQRVTGMSEADDTTKEIALPAKPVNAALTALLTLEARALRVADMPFGSSLLCLARRRAG